MSQLEFAGKIHKEKHDEMRSSTITLTNALVRLEDENAARALVENTQQSEVLRLKSALEKANAEADRLKHLTVDMEEQIAKLVPPQLMEEKEAHIHILRKEMSQMRASHRETMNKYETLNNAFTRAEENEDNSDDESSRPAISLTSNVIVSDLVNQIESLKARLREGKRHQDATREDSNIQGEVRMGKLAPARQDINTNATPRSLLCSSQGFQPQGNFFEGKGYTEDVPEFLRYFGPIRNWRLSKRECERAVNDVWIAKEEWAEENEDEPIHLR